VSEAKPPSSFIHSDLDDTDLTPQEFRVLCHIIRRGKCWESVPAIAQHCRINRKTAWRVMSELVRRRMVKADRRPGQSTVYEVRPVPDWHPSQKEAHVSKRDDTRPKRGADHPSQKRPHKVTPSEVYPSKDIPKVFSFPGFNDSWERWQQHLRGVGRKLSKQSREAQLKELDAMGGQRAIAALEHSIAKNWFSIHEPSASSHGSHDRNAGTANQGKHSQYEGIGKVGWQKPRREREIVDIEVPIL
jgi:hypothetical protein